MTQERTSVASVFKDKPETFNFVANDEEAWQMLEKIKRGGLLANALTTKTWTQSELVSFSRLHNQGLIEASQGGFATTKFGNLAIEALSSTE